MGYVVRPFEQTTKTVLQTNLGSLKTIVGKEGDRRNRRSIKVQGKKSSFMLNFRKNTRKFLRKFLRIKKDTNILIQWLIISSIKNKNSKFFNTTVTLFLNIHIEFLDYFYRLTTNVSDSFYLIISCASIW